LLRSLQEIQPFLMEEDCGGGQGLSWAVEPRREREGDRKAESGGRESLVLLFIELAIEKEK
jgi:hypothetical protein